MRCSSPGVPGIAHGTRERLGIAPVGMEILRIRFEVHGNFGKIRDARNFPGLRAVRQISVGKNDDRHHVFDRDAGGFHRDPEAVAGRCRRENRNRSFGVAAKERLQQVGLLGLGRQTGRRAAALDVADHERQFDGNGQSHRFGFEGHARTGRGGDPDAARVSGANRRSDGRNFVFGLERDHAEILVSRKLVQNVRRRRDRIRAEKKRKAGFLRGGHKTHRQRVNFR